MKFQAFDELRNVADVQTAQQDLTTRIGRLERWADLLERDASRRLRSLGEIEFVPPAERAFMRVQDSPLTVAYEDAVLRTAGLASDRLGDAITFFSLSEREAHRLQCSCLNGWSMSAGTTAHRVRKLNSPNARLTTAAWIGAIGVLGAVPFLMHWL
jgi:hypothetical protein